MRTAEFYHAVLQHKRMAYLIADAQGRVLAWGGWLDLLPAVAENLELTELIPELAGCEDILADVQEGRLADFTLENLNRVAADGETLYLTLDILPDHSASPAQLLVLLSDTSEWTRTQQTLTQQRNELSLLKHRLDEANQRLDFIVRHYVPREVGQALLENRILLTRGGETREVTALFVDLRNYTGLSEQFTPAQIIEVLQVFLDIASAAIRDTGGVVVNYMGDAVMAIFNAPDEQPDHALRAVRAGLIMQATPLLHPLIQNHGTITSLHFGVGINTGMALVGNIGSQQHFQYTAVGDAINVAARICSHAPADAVWIGENTHACLRPGAVHAEPLAPIRVKGKSQDLQVYQVMGVC